MSDESKPSKNGVNESDTVGSDPTLMTPPNEIKLPDAIANAEGKSDMNGDDGL